MKNSQLLMLIIPITLLIGNLSASQAEETILLKVSAGKQTRENCVVTCPLPNEFKDAVFVELVRVDNKKLVAAQIDRTHQQAELVWVLKGKLKKGTTRQYRLHITAKTGRVPLPRVIVTDDKKRINIKADGKPVLSYNHVIVEAPKREQYYYDKSGHIHPLYTPSGKVITDDFNPNHAHQHGIMFTWRKILFDGRENNGWDQKSKLGKVTHRKLGSLISGSVFGSFTATINHIDLTSKEGTVTMLNETWNVRVFAMGDRFLFDIKSVQKCATDKPVTIQKYHYGGMTIRGHADWSKKHSYNYLTSEGKHKENGNHSRPQWVEMYGPLKDKTAGVTILCHPENFRFPQPVRLHPTMPYFCFAVSVLGEFQIKPNKPYVSRYRYMIHDGKPDAKTNQQLWKDFANPPKVKIVSNK